MSRTPAAVSIALAAALLLASIPSRSLAQAWNHDPVSPLGPARWGSLSFPFATCGTLAADGTLAPVGRRQSPVDLTGALPASATVPIFHYGNTPFEVENTSHVVEVPYAPGSRMVIGGDDYELLQFHFHGPAEHAVEGRLAPLELHLVHRDALGNLAVVGVLFEVSADPNPLVDEIFAAAPVVAGVGGVERRTLNARDLLPGNTARFWTYSGSLTTPPCSEGVRWTVLSTPVGVSQGALDRFRTIVADFPGYGGFAANNRPVQPLNGRTILVR
jgi:carbonic anhydrase